MKPNKYKARFGEPFWDRFSHIGTLVNGKVVVIGFNEHGEDVIWPRPCKYCVEMLEEDL